jgi:hypothetical protein
VVPYPIARGSAAAYYPETNVLVPIRSVARGSNQPASKSLLVTLAPSDTTERAATHSARRSAHPI